MGKKRSKPQDTTTYHDRSDLAFPGKKSLLENIQNQLSIKGDVWIHHAYNVPMEDPLTIDNDDSLQYQDTVIIPSILHTLMDKTGSQKTTSLAAICGMKTPELLLILDPATLNLSAVTKERLWITEILLKEAGTIFPAPNERTLALCNLYDPNDIEVIHEDVTLEITGHRTEGGITQDSALGPLDSNYTPVIGKKDPGKSLRDPLKRSSDIGELVLMISDAISSSAKMYLGTVNVRLHEDRVSLEYPKEANVACIKLFSNYIDVLEIRSPSQPHNPDLQLLNFRIYRTRYSRNLKILIKLLHLL